MSDFSHILFIDIETVPGKSSLKELPSDLRELWNEKVRSMQARMPERFNTTDSEDDVYRREAGIFAEFGKIVCISVGFFYKKDNQEVFREKSFYDDDEKQLLSDFADMLSRLGNKVLCGHNIKEFDVPYICRRMLINKMELPLCLNVSGKKPWEINMLDTLDLWRFGDYKNYTSLKLLTAVFGIPTPKDDIDGSQVANVYYEQHDLQRIAFYCEKDVLATARLYACYKGKMPVADELVEHVKNS